MIACMRAIAPWGTQYQCSIFSTLHTLTRSQTAKVPSRLGTKVIGPGRASGAGEGLGVTV